MKGEGGPRIGPATSFAFEETKENGEKKADVGSGEGAVCNERDTSQTLDNKQSTQGGWASGNPVQASPTEVKSGCS